MDNADEILSPNDKGLNFTVLLEKLLSKKFFLIKTLILGILFGTFVAFGIPKEYTASTILTLDSESSRSSETMGTLASLAGINVNKMASGDVLASPDLYKDIFESTPFLKGLFSIPVEDDKHTIKYTLYDYLESKQKVSWWDRAMSAPFSVLLKLFSSTKDSLQESQEKWTISKQEMDVIQSLQERITVEPNKKTGLTKISVTMQDPHIAVLLTDTLSSYFQFYIIKYRTQKARTDLEFAQKLYDDSKERYFKSQNDLATFQDENRNVISAKFRTTQDRLQSEASLRYSIYNQAAQQLQIAKVKVQDQTPVLTTIQPAIKPLLPSKPSKKIIILGFALLAFTSSVLWVLRKDLYEYLSDNNQ